MARTAARQKHTFSDTPHMLAPVGPGQLSWQAAGSKSFQRGKQKEAREEHREIVKGPEEIQVKHQHLIYVLNPTLWIKIDFLSRIHHTLGRWMGASSAKDM